MKRTLTLFAAFILVSVFAIATSAQDKPVEAPKPKAEEPKKDPSPILSKWDILISAPGQEYPGTLNLEKTGDVYKGSVTTEFGEAPLTNIKVEGDGFSALIVVNAQGQVFDGTMSGKAKDGKISGELNLNGLGALPFSGKKP